MSDSSSCASLVLCAPCPRWVFAGLVPAGGDSHVLFTCPPARPALRGREKAAISVPEAPGAPAGHLQGQGCLQGSSSHPLHRCARSTAGAEGGILPGAAELSCVVERGSGPRAGGPVSGLGHSGGDTSCKPGCGGRGLATSGIANRVGESVQRGPISLAHGVPGAPAGVTPALLQGRPPNRKQTNRVLQAA